jgi:hypothetical protein
MTRALALTVWCLVVASIVALEVAGVVHDRFPRFGDYLTALCRTRVGRTLVLVGWVWLGWHLFVRAS